ncbi:GGDEF domain-containing protein [Hephaestia mangrovi]|uniref:GGDEF domain-containing protein n=1 Tax=Hephaestia mangrovi TaxID=2873268 RepID=UPI001CA6E795|nr:GGDEF domain-containing protein [Hephaestia mangrovi]MBY8828826.1 GGDEF domain-containing protein [Hephaestia mangrovi]
MATDWLPALFDWFSGLPRAEAVRHRREIVNSVMLRPVPLLLSSCGILLMSGTAALFLAAPWAIAWFAADLFLMSLRFWVAWRFQRGVVMPERIARLTISLAGITFVLFGFGCCASFLTGLRPMPMLATTSMMALIAGLATRWAALPRLAIPAITAVSIPFCVAIALTDHGAFAIGAVQFGMVAAGTATLALQNHRTLVASWRAGHHARELAMTDALTGLPNRAALFDRLATRRATVAPGTDSGMALLFVDLDRFKAINDRYGHTVGDRILVALARRLGEVAAPHFVCRLGGDEFVVMVEGAAVAAASPMARRIADVLAEPVTGLAEEAIVAGASVGIALGSSVYDDPERILADADAALYLAKRAGGGREAVAVANARFVAA